MRTKRLILLLLLCCGSLCSHAVLTGRTLDRTVNMLKSELEVFDSSILRMGKEFHRMRAFYTYELKEQERELLSLKLSLESQQEQFIFGQSYTAEKALAACRAFERTDSPVQNWINSYEQTLARCKSMEKTLAEMPEGVLKGDARQGREECLALVRRIISNLERGKGDMDSDEAYYQSVKATVAELRQEAEASYSTIHKRIFFHSDVPYSSILQNWSTYWEQFKSMFKSMFTPRWLGWQYFDSWSFDAWMLLICCLLALPLGMLLGRLVFRRWVLPAAERTHFDFVGNAPSAFYMASGLVLVMVVLLALRFFVIRNPYYVSAIWLLIEFCLLLLAMVCSLLARVRKSLFPKVQKMYMPTVIITAVALFYRIMLVNSMQLQVTFFPLLLLVTLMLLVACVRYRKILPAFDHWVGIISLAVYGVCCVMACRGLNLLSLQIVQFWSLLLTGHLALSCYYIFLRRCERYRCSVSEEDFRNSWRPFTFNRLFRPMALALVLFVCVVVWASFFNIGDWVYDMLTYKFINLPKVACVSVLRLVMILILGILVNWLLGLFKYLMRRNYGERADRGSLGLSSRAITILAWGIFLVVALAIIEINSMGIVAALGGLTVGIGIALRDTFDCFFCGITLMMGRLKIGDYVELDGGIRGKVVDIQYRSTLIETDFGDLISVFNTAFFDKSIRNVSRLNDYEGMMLNFKIQKEGVEVDDLMEKLRQGLIEDVPQLSPEHEPVVLFGSTDRFFIEMQTIVYIDVDDYYMGISNVKKSLFLTLKKNGLSNMNVDSRVRVLQMDGLEGPKEHRHSKQ